MTSSTRLREAFPIEIIGCDSVAHVEENVRLARDFTPLSDREMASLSERTKDIARQALFFRRWA